MDGYFYVAVGDKGVYGAVGTDGRRVDLHGGGILRLRPDGTELEVYCTGVRNILDVALNAEDEIFTYDNTDEHDWMCRLTHMVDGGFYGYPYDFIPRRPYTLWMMADYGGGRGHGAPCYTEDALPPEYHGNLFLADFGKRQVLRVTRRARRRRRSGPCRRRTCSPIRPGDSARWASPVGPDGLGLYICDWQHRDKKARVSVGRALKTDLDRRRTTAPRSRPGMCPRRRGRSLQPRPMNWCAACRIPSHERPSDSAAATGRTVRRRRNCMTLLIATCSAPALARSHAIWALDARDDGRAAREEIIAVASKADPVVQRRPSGSSVSRRVTNAVPVLVTVRGQGSLRPLPGRIGSGPHRECRRGVRACVRTGGTGPVRSLRSVHGAQSHRDQRAVRLVGHREWFGRARTSESGKARRWLCARPTMNSCSRRSANLFRDTEKPASRAA